MSIGKRVLRKDFQVPRGDIPVYSANVFEPFVYSDVSNITDYHAPYVIWGIDGFFDFNVAGIGKPFATTDHCGAIKILNPNIDPFFLAHMLRESSHLYGFDRGLRASITNMEIVKIVLPTTKDGKYDIEYQRFIAEQLESVNQLKRDIRQKRNQLSQINVLIYDADYLTQSVKLTDKNLFNLITRGIGQNKTTLTTIDTHDETKIPVYTAGLEPVAFVQPLQNKPVIDARAEKPILSFATNGDGSAGRNFVLHTRPFYINTDRIAVEIIDRCILPEYLLSQLYDMKRKYKFGHSFKANRHNLQSVSIEIPVNDSGNFDVETQRQIASAYASVEQYRLEILKKLDALLTQRIDY